MFLLEEAVQGDIKAMVEEAKGWWEQWFDEIKEWTLEAVDNERLAWLRCYGVPCHAWSSDFFKFIMSLVGCYMCSDKEMMNQTKMDVARILENKLFLEFELNIQCGY